MRLLLTLELIKTFQLPINYYPLSSGIYELLKFGQPEFATYLHNIDFNPKIPSLKIQPINSSFHISTSVKIMERV